MRVIAKSRLKEYWDKYPVCKQQLLAWHDEIKKGTWANFNELKQNFPAADFVGNGRVVFNIKGGAYRLISKFEFKGNTTYIRFFGTHKDYDKINASEA